MTLPVSAPVRPMLARATVRVPRGERYVYEPKWDGFRCVVFRDGGDLTLESRTCRPLLPYFPEMVAPLSAVLPQRCVVDGELVVASDDGLDLEKVQARIHPAASRIARLSEETPAAYVAFDLLALGDRDLRSEPFEQRRDLLTRVLRPRGRQVVVTPATTDPEVAEDWFRRFEGAGFDGVMAKHADGTYREGERSQWKVKPVRTADCVVGGFRWHKDGQGIGSLLLGVYDERSVLQYAGVASSFAAARRRELVDELAPLRTGMQAHPWSGWQQAGRAGVDAGEPGAVDPAARMPGALNRWNASRDHSWEPLHPAQVVEVRYEQARDRRFRAATRMVRWRPDKDPAECTADQLESAPPAELTGLIRGNLTVGSR